ncbi:hypothetical protein [Chelativorans intermedius]|uniref:Flagellar assembly protein FliH/Type III secretion system HrpE domain-containing protein n=1 Tax=Chelativorans intermedius TaxID=515947 RepID=A0ABV6D8R3_9HYPH|nr:hypothetical protein [Chelativorans intermedius]MCT8997777.1 hypothetical protein [Chelativorans intermedius]
MPGLALADALPDFGAAAPARRAVAPDMEPAFAPPRPEAPDAGEERQTLEEAVARAEEALAQRLERQHAERLAAERARHEEEMAAARRQLAEEAGALIAARFDKMQREVTALTAALSARILGVVLTEDLQKRAVEELTRIVAAALEDREAVRIRVKGSALLCDALRASLGERAAQVEFSEAGDFDLTAEIDESLFETRLGEWSQALAEVLS